MHQNAPSKLDRSLGPSIRQGSVASKISRPAGWGPLTKANREVLVPRLIIGPCRAVRLRRHLCRGVASQIAMTLARG